MSTAISECVSNAHEPTSRSTKLDAENKSNELAPAIRALEGCEKFSTRLEKSPSYKNLSDKYANEIATSNRDTLREMLRRQLDDANAAEQRFEQRGKLRRFYQRTTRFLSTFGTYLDEYGGIVELMSAAGGQYGRAAYSTLSILLVVAVNKQHRDDRIAEVLLQLCKQFSRFKILEHIHPTSKMKMYLANAYEIGIDFARYAVFYYLRSSIGRLWSVMVGPPGIFEETLAEVTTALEDVRAEGQFLDSQRLHEVDQTVRDMDARYAKMEEDVKRTQWKSELEKIRDRMLPKHQSIAKATNDYQVRLEATFDGQRKNLYGRLAELQASKAYRGWRCSQKPSFLILRGEAKCLTHYCWFSPLVFRLFQGFREANETIAFHCCQDTDSSDKGDKFVSLLNNIAFQVLETMPHPLDPSHIKSIWKKMDNIKWGEDPALTLGILSVVLPTLKTACLIVDRADLLRGDWEECLESLSLMASPTVSGGCVVKIILVGSRVTSDWRGLKERMIGLVGEKQLFDLECSESDWEP